MQFSPNFKNYVLLAILLFYVIIITLFFVSQQEFRFRFSEGMTSDISGNTKTSGNTISSGDTITITTAEVNSFYNSLNALQTQFTTMTTPTMT
jgi:hypothetical protein